VISVDDIRDRIIGLLRAAPDGLQGTLLAAELKRDLGEFRPTDYGLRNLKEFVLAHVPDAKIAGKAGADLIYVLGSAVPSAATVVSPERASDAWTTWALPTSPRVLQISEAGDIDVVTPDQATSPQILRPLPQHAHRDIALRFIEEGADISPVLLSELKKALEDPTNSWWSTWVTTIRKAPSINTRWMRFRGTRLQEALREQLSQLSLSEEAKKRVLDLIEGSRRARPRRAAESHRAAVPADHQTRDLRTLIKEVVDRLDESGLRRLELPVGLVYDALKNRSR